MSKNSKELSTVYNFNIRLKWKLSEFRLRVSNLLRVLGNCCFKLRSFWKINTKRIEVDVEGWAEERKVMKKNNRQQYTVLQKAAEAMSISYRDLNNRIRTLEIGAEITINALWKNLEVESFPLNLSHFCWFLQNLEYFSQTVTHSAARDRKYFNNLPLNPFQDQRYYEFHFHSIQRPAIIDSISLWNSTRLYVAVTCWAINTGCPEYQNTVSRFTSS